MNRIVNFLGRMVFARIMLTLTIMASLVIWYASPVTQSFFLVLAGMLFIIMLLTVTE